MLFGGLETGSLEVRRAADGSQTLRGRFPYGQPAVLSDGGRNGRPRKEIIAPRAFRYRIEDPKEDIHLLVGHSYDRPLASKSTGTLNLTDTDAALLFEAIITPALSQTSYVQGRVQPVARGDRAADGGVAVGWAALKRTGPPGATSITRWINRQDTK